MTLNGGVWCCLEQLRLPVQQQPRPVQVLQLRVHQQPQQVPVHLLQLLRVLLLQQLVQQHRPLLVRRQRYNYG